MDPIQRFFTYTVPELVKQGKLVIVSETEVYWVGKEGRLTNIFQSPKYLRVRLADYLPAAPPDDEEASRRRKSTLRAAEDSVCVGSRYAEVPDELSVRAITRVPALIHHRGRYYPIPKGHHEKLRTYSLCEPINPTPAKGYLEYFFSSLGLSPANQARVLSFFTGCVLRPCFMGMPALMLRSPYKNVGKTTIARVAGALMTGSLEPATFTWNGDREFAKRLSACDTVCPFVFLDNLDARESPFRSDTLAVATQTGQINQRLLGVSRTMTVRQPTFVVTMQGGTISADLMDRLLYICLDVPRPAVVKEDLMVWLRSNFERLRDELVTLVLQTTPDAPTPIGNYRFVDFFRHVAPVVRLFGLDPMVVAEPVAQEAQAEVVRLYRLLAKHCNNGKAKGLTIDELLAHVDGEHAFSHLVPEGSDEGRKANLRGLLALMPSAIREPHSILKFSKRLTDRGMAYSVITEVLA